MLRSKCVQYQGNLEEDGLQTGLLDLRQLFIAEPLCCGLEEHIGRPLVPSFSHPRTLFGSMLCELHISKQSPILRKLKTNGFAQILELARKVRLDCKEDMKDLGVPWGLVIIARD
ncbi:hypothetical protein PsYK624_136730 [Phanerochaete sordida]|uniref:Uncharacterized protein n=1 Tax=Phanerochaete sordida TaxID=48140 RepID=A0A9P3GNG5_9APHY|nr:hypothetical protein PsYK624_136730 [Phanerochaete sordida]